MEVIQLEPYLFEGLSIQQLLPTVLYMRSTNAIEGCTFTLAPMEQSAPQTKVFEAQHDVPPILKMIIKMKTIPMREIIDFSGIPESIVVTSESAHQNSQAFPYMKTVTVFSKAEGGTLCTTECSLRLFKSEMPKFMKKQFRLMAEKKAKKVRKDEIAVARENFA